MGNKPKKFDFVHQIVSVWETRTGGARDYIHNTVSILLNVYCPNLCLPDITTRRWKEGMGRRDWDGWERGEGRVTGGEEGERRGRKGEDKRRGDNRKRGGRGKLKEGIDSRGR